MKQILWDALPRWLLTFLVCLALCLGFGAVFQIDLSLWIAVPALLVWCGVLSLERFKSIRILLAVWIAALVLILLLSDRELLADAAREIAARTGESGGYGGLMLLMLCAGLALPLSALMRFYPARAALSLAWIALWIAGALLEWPVPRLVPALMIPVVLLTLAETVRRLRHEAEDEPLKRALLLCLLPALLLLLLLPVSEEPYGYPLLHRIADQIQQIWHDMETAARFRYEGDRQFGLSFNGISDKAEVGDGIKEEDSGVIYIKPGRTTDGALYLFGNAWDTFNGKGWSSTLKSDDAKYLNWSLDTAEHIFALWRSAGIQDGSESFSDYFRANSIYLDCRSINIRTMFGVLDATHIYTDTERFPYSAGPTGTLFDYVQQDEVWYKVYFLEKNARTYNALIASAKETAPGGETRLTRWYRVAQSFSQDLWLDVRSDMYMERIFAEREELIRRVYLDCTGVSERAAALAQEITADCESDYEKLCAITAYLQDNYGYTTDPDPVPKGEDFLDWLLFERKEGYCAWYATAAVLLARSVGVPARYVQGYRCELTAGEYTKLGAEDAHAWCEGYISGYGWVTAEATPGFVSEGVGWLTAEEEKVLQSVAPEAAATPKNAKSPEGVGLNDEELPPPPPVEREPEIEAKPFTQQEEEKARFPWLTVILIAALAASVPLLRLWLRSRRQRRYAQAGPAERLQMDLETLLRDLRGKGYPRAPEESLRQYFERLPGFLIDDAAEAREMTALYDRTFFALKAPSEAELEKHRAFAAHFRPRTLRQWITWYSLQ